MKLKTVRALLGKAQVSLLVGLGRMIKPFYRLAYLAAAGDAGLFEMLRDGPRSAEAILAELGGRPGDILMLEAWLDVGIQLGDLERVDGLYGLASRWATQLADPRNDPILASIQEATYLHFEAITRIPEMLRTGRRFGRADYRSEEIVRASRLVEPLNHEAIELVVPSSGKMRYLDMGCGLGRNLLHAAGHNPDLVGIGIEVDPEVVPLARENVRSQGFADRVKIVEGDVRTTDFGRPFDVICSNSNIYYFAPETRVPLFERLHGMLAPGGRLLVTSACRGGSLGLELINTWFCAADFGGPLPTPEEVPPMLETAGFGDIRVHRLFPGESVYAFVATRES